MIEEWEEDEWPPDEEKAELRAELEALRTKWDAIPWDAIHRCAGDSFGHHDPARSAAVVFAWLAANAPEASHD